MTNTATGRLIIISGPSGAGKSTLVRELIDQCPLPLALSVSAATRAPRQGETDGVDYHFLSHEEFARRRENDEFLEFKEVFKRGDFYGTLRSEVSTGLASGKWVILEIDVEGAETVVSQCPEAITLFIHPGSLEELEERLRSRGTDDEAAIQRRLEVARHELNSMDRYQHEIINRRDATSEAVTEISKILEQYK